MSTKLALLSVVGAASVAAAAAGGYVALRTNDSHAQPAPAQIEAARVEAPPAATTSGAVVDEKVLTPAQPVVETVAAASPARPAKAPAPMPAPVVTPRTRTSTATPASSPSKDVAPAAPAALPVYAPEPPASDLKPPTFDPPPVTPIEPPKPRFDDVTVKDDTVIGIRLDSMVTTATAKVEDKVTAHVARDVVVDGRTAIPSNARLEGVVAIVERGGKFKDRARLGIRFQSLVLPDNTRVPIQTEMIFREGDSPTGAASSKVGAGAVLGTILGAAIGGKKGAVIGATTGAAGGTAAVMAGDQKEAVLTAGTPLTVRLTSPVTVTIEREAR